MPAIIPASISPSGRCSRSSVVWEGALEVGREAWSGPHGGSRLPSKDELHSLPSWRECTLRRGGACALGEMGARERRGAGQKGLLWGRITPNPAQRSWRSLLSCRPNLESLHFPTHLPRKQRRRWGWGGGWLPASCLFTSGKGAQGPKAVLGPLSALGPWALLAFFCFAIKPGVGGGPTGSSGDCCHTHSSRSSSTGVCAFLLPTNTN